MYKNHNKFSYLLLFFVIIAFVVAVFSFETYKCAFGEKTWWECVEISMKNSIDRVFGNLISKMESSKSAL